MKTHMRLACLFFTVFYCRIPPRVPLSEIAVEQGGIGMFIFQVPAAVNGDVFGHV